MARSKVSQLACSTLAVVVLLVLCMTVVGATASEHKNDEMIGYGYEVKYAKVDDTAGKSLSALLQLIRSSSVYGPDVKLLGLTASLEEDDTLRIRITDANNHRWEIPNDVLPRPPPISPPPFSTLQHQNQSNITVLSHPHSDLTFTLSHSSPFGFSISRKSNHDILFDTTKLCNLQFSFS